MLSIVTGLQKTACDVVTTVITEEYSRERGREILIAYLGLGLGRTLNPVVQGSHPRRLDSLCPGWQHQSPHDEMAGKETMAYRRGRMCEWGGQISWQPAVLRADCCLRPASVPQEGNTRLIRPQCASESQPWMMPTDNPHICEAWGPAFPTRAWVRLVFWVAGA